ncbi:hypothetical protein [Bauldia litoralis]|uniref:hypothetical protein n=1 Tax=Bauldia litoralis TaxID=665467 RepID=UPI003266F76D
MNDVFILEKNIESLTFSSVQRMPHKSRKGPLDVARQELRTALEAFKAAPGQIIEGVYSSLVEGYFDVENVLLYNIEPAAFRNSAVNGLRLRRCRSGSDNIVEGFAHKMVYRLIPVPRIPASHLVRLTFVPDRLKDPFDVWWASGMGQASSTGTILGTYGIYVELGGPIPPKNPAQRVKPLFDGIIASLQRDSLPDAVAIERLSQKHRIDSGLIKERLMNPIVSAISASRSKRLVRQYREGVQWHPADDLCEECTLIVTRKPAPICNAFVYALPGNYAGDAPL